MISKVFYSTDILRIAKGESNIVATKTHLEMNDLHGYSRGDCRASYPEAQIALTAVEITE